MVPNAHNLLREQIKKVHGEERQIRKDLATQEKKVKGLQARLKDIDLTAQQLKNFQRQLKGGEIIWMSSKRGASEMDDVEEEGNGVSLENSSIPSLPPTD